jgi:predicted nuclease of predicted toxin-antitoxin system
LTLKIKVDENLPVEAAGMLIQAGHDALTVLDQKMGGRPDFEIANLCRSERRAIMTLDLDFADIRAYSPIDYPGIIVLRLSRLDKDHVLAAIQRMLPILDQEELDRKLWIVGESSIRIRG